MTDKYKNLIGSIRTLSDGIETRQEYDTLINKIKNIVRGSAAKGDDDKDPTNTRTNALRKSIQNNVHKKIDEEEKMAAKNFGLSQSLIDAASRVAESTYQVGKEEVDLFESKPIFSSEAELNLNKHISDFAKGIKSSAAKPSVDPRHGRPVPDMQHVATDSGHEEILNHLKKMGYKKDPAEAITYAHPKGFGVVSTGSLSRIKVAPLYHSSGVSAHLEKEHSYPGSPSGKTKVHFTYDRPSASRNQMIDYHYEPPRDYSHHDESASYHKEDMDPVGKEDPDVNNDNSSDSYLKKRREAIFSSIKKMRGESVISEGGTGNAMDTLQNKMRIMANLRGKPEEKKPEEKKKPEEAVKEESALEEGRRGRPPKVGSAAYAAQMANAQEDEPDQHIIMQLKKAADSTDKPHVIAFKNGAKAVPHAIAQKALDRYMGQKTADKRKHQKHLATSHENLISYASGK